MDEQQNTGGMGDQMAPQEPAPMEPPAESMAPQEGPAMPAEPVAEPGMPAEEAPAEPEGVVTEDPVAQEEPQPTGFLEKLKRMLGM